MRVLLLQLCIFTAMGDFITDMGMQTNDRFLQIW